MFDGALQRCEAGGDVACPMRQQHDAGQHQCRAEAPYQAPLFRRKHAGGRRVLQLVERLKRGDITRLYVAAEKQAILNVDGRQ